MLFRKAHGPLLQSENRLPYEKGQKQKKEVEEAVATPRASKRAAPARSVPGFVFCDQFAADIVRMLGNFVLCVQPQLYLIIL